MAIAIGDPQHRPEADWHRRVVDRSLRAARQRSIERGGALVRVAGDLLFRSGGDGFTVQQVADEAGQSLRTLYQYFAGKDDLLLAVFEEAMTTYADLIVTAIAPLDAPLERLAGALIAASRLPQTTDDGLNRGLARLRLQLAETEPALVGRSQAPVAGLVSQLIAEACEAQGLDAVDVEATTFLVLSLNTASITSRTLGNDTGVAAPDPVALAQFCIRGLGLDRKRSWFQSVNRRLALT